MIYVYTDASLRHPCLGIGCVITDENKNVIESRQNLIHVGDEYSDFHSQEAEFRALATAARVACEYDEKVIFMTDNDTLPLHVAEDEFSTNSSALHSFKSFAGRLDDWEIVWRPRQENLAHDVADEMTP
jgi:hypothetical protein